MDQENKKPTPKWCPFAGAQLEQRVDDYRRLRDTCPVPFTNDEATGRRFWSVLGYKDLSRVVRDTETFSNGKLRRLGARRPPLETDPPEHATIRRVLQPFVSPSAMQASEASTRASVLALLLPLLEQGAGDIAMDFARPLPAQVLLHWLDLPHSDWRNLKDWSDDVRPRAFLDEDDRNAFQRGDALLWQYSRDVVTEKRRQPRDPKTDVVCALLAANVSDDDAAGVVRLLVSAGHDSTSQALGICFYYLATHPALQAQLRAEPALIRTAVEEILRLNSPVVAMPRIVTKDVVIGESQLLAGEQLLINWASANRDPAMFPDADDLDINRKPNPHVVFGMGVHSCLGAPLARQELRIALEELLARTANFSLAAEPQYMRIHHYGFDNLVCTLERKPAG